MDVVVDMAEVKALRKHVETLRTQLSEARKEIELQSMGAANVANRNKVMEAELAEARAEVERLDGKFTVEQGMAIMHKKAEERALSRATNAESALTACQRERDDAVSYAAYLREKTGDLEISTAAEKAGQIMDIVEAAKAETKIENELFGAVIEHRGTDIPDPLRKLHDKQWNRREAVRALAQPATGKAGEAGE